MDNIVALLSDKRCASLVTLGMSFVFNFGGVIKAYKFYSNKYLLGAE